MRAPSQSADGAQLGSVEHSIPPEVMVSMFSVRERIMPPIFVDMVSHLPKSRSDTMLCAMTRPSPRNLTSGTSDEPEGTQFPVFSGVRLATRAVMPTKHQETAITGAFNILLVEDDAELAQALERELTLLDHRITTVVDGRQAFEAITRNSFDAAILDRMLPDADGLETLRRLRDGHVTLPILMLTAMGRSSEKIEGLFAGADDYVAKPVTAAEIDARLRALIRARQWTSKEADTISAGDIVVSPTKFRAWRKGKALDLPTLELELLAELARNVAPVHYSATDSR
jgi:DNA-binding response OmpR family regulator